MITICRDSLIKAVQSLYQQKNINKLQILVGVDIDVYGREHDIFRELMACCPKNVTLTWISIGYSTSVRHGGVHVCHYGGSLRSALTMLADSEIVMYLDDDDWIDDMHCADILKAIADKKWAFAYSIYADGNKGVGVCVDEIESVGVGGGFFAEQFGGFVRPSGMAINKLQLMHIVHLWAYSPYPTGDGEDRVIFNQLRPEPFGCTNRASVYYAIDPMDGIHSLRLDFMKSKGIEYIFEEKQNSCRQA
jgi:hypothetical protein